MARAHSAAAAIVPYVDFPERSGSSEMESFSGSEMRDAARLLGLATIAADKGDFEAVHAHLGELAAKIDALRLRLAALKPWVVGPME